MLSKFQWTHLKFFIGKFNNEEFVKILKMKLLEINHCFSPSTDMAAIFLILTDNKNFDCVKQALEKWISLIDITNSTDGTHSSIEHSTVLKGS